MSKDRDLQRYFDGELGRRRARQVHAELEADQEQQKRFEAMSEMSEMLKQSVGDAAEEADFSGFFAGVEKGIKKEAPPTVGERMAAWFRRFGMVTASAVAVAALLLIVFVPRMATKATNDCEIENLDVGPGAIGTIFTIDDPEDSGSTTVIWVASASDTEGEAS